MKKRLLTLALGLALAVPAVVLLEQRGIRADAGDAQDVEAVQIAVDATNFPDENFLYYVENFIDEEEPKGILTEDEILAVTSFDCYAVEIRNLKGIEFFTELTYLNCSKTLLTELDLSKNTKIEEVFCYYCDDLTSINLTGCAALQEFDCNNCANLKSLNLSGCVALENLVCNRCVWLTELDLKDCVALKDLECYNDDRLTALDLSSCTAVDGVYAYNCKSLTSLNVSGCAAMRYLSCEGCPLLLRLDVSTCTSLDDLDCYEDGLTELVLGSHPKLTRIDCSINDLTALDVSNCPKLRMLYCYENEIATLKVNRNPDLRLLECDGNPVKEIEIYSSPMLLTLIEMVPDPVEKAYGHHNGSTVHYYRYEADVEERPGSLIHCVLDIDVGDVLITNAPVYSISVTTDGNGTASASITSGTEYMVGTLSAIPNDGYLFKEWQVVSGDVKIADAASATTSFEIGHGNGEIRAIFREATFEDFIERMYVVALNRPSEPDGKAFWMDKVKNEGFTGGRVAIGFLIEAPEFLNRDLTDEQFLDVLYRTFFDRPADDGGKAFWLGHLATDMTREQVVRGFIDSTEWCNLCAFYGVKSGAPNAKAEKPSRNALKFATRLYTECLGREPDADGLQFWALRLTNLESTGYEAAKGFFESQEFQNKNVDDETYVKLLYRTFMGRDYDQGGLEFWMGHLATDMNRLQVLQGFAQSQEFTNICNEYGIDRGTI